MSPPPLLTSASSTQTSSSDCTPVPGRWNPPQNRHNQLEDLNNGSKIQESLMRSSFSGYRPHQVQMASNRNLRGKGRAQTSMQRRRSGASPRPSSSKARTTGRQSSSLRKRKPSPTRRSRRAEKTEPRTPKQEVRQSKLENSAACLTPLQDLPRSLSPGQLDEHSEYYQQDLSLHKLKLTTSTKRRLKN